MESLILLIVLVVLAVPVLLVVALVQLGSVRARVSSLEHDVARIKAAPPTAQPMAPAQTRGLPDPPATPVTPAASAPTPPASSPPRPAAPAPARAPAPAASATRATPGAPREPGVVDIGLRLIRRWFTEGNVPVKVGMLVLFAGVAALLKYASDQGWMTLPLELRLAAIGAAAIAGLALGWRQRTARRVFALSLQGGSIGVLLMTVFSAFRVFAVMPAGAAFAISVVLVAGTGVLAVAQNARALAVLAILAGFLSPVLVSTGEGSHVALFSYYTLLNLGILAVAWHRPWRELNLLGFVFTFGIGTVWGVLAYRPEHQASTLPFLALFFALYLLIPLLYARRRGAQRRDLVDGCLVFGNPLLSFALLAAVLDGARMPLALSALGLAVVYVVLAWRLLKLDRYRPLAESWALLGAGFATLAVPLALSARATASVFALEGAALVWLGLRQGRRLPLWSGTALQGLAALSLLIGYAGHPDELAIANPGFMGAFVLSLAGFASTCSCHRGARPRLALAFYLWGLAWWLFAGGGEILRHGERIQQPTFWIGFMAVSLAVLGVAMRRTRFQALRWTAVAALAGVVYGTLAQTDFLDHPFQYAGSWIWPAFAIAGAYALAAMRALEHRGNTWSLGLWLVSWSLAFSILLAHLADRSGLAAGWQVTAGAVPWLLVLAGLVFAPQRIGMPLQTQLAHWQRPVTGTFQALGLFIWLLLLFHPGGSQPLPWLPVLNPVELATLAAVGLMSAWLWSGIAPDGPTQRRAHIVAVLTFLTLSAFTLRGVHHLGGIPWAESMFRTALAQSSLTLLWSVLGVAAWILGSRRGLRPVWLAGAVLMGVVLVKLVLVDRQHLGNLAGIASFIGYGLLCTAVGYFAPAPPRADGADTPVQEGA